MMEQSRLDIYTILKNDSSVTALLDEISSGVPAIFAHNVIPSHYQDLEKVINISHINGKDSGQYQQHLIQVSCRSTTEDKAIEIGEAVYNALNRVFGTDYYTQAVLQPPISEDYHWHVPVEITHRS